MQQTPSSPAAAPAAPSAPAAGQAVIAQSPGADPIELTGLPTNVQEVEGLQERREILRDQLDRAGNRRDELLQELRSAEAQNLPAEARTGIQQRLNLLDGRILQLEADQAYTERLLSNAPPAVLAEIAAQEPVYRPGSVDEDEAFGMMFGGFGFGVLLAVAIGRFRRRGWRLRRRGGAAGATATASLATADDPRIERLTQAVDAIAEEVERIGEGQRFVTQLLANRREREGAMIGAEAERR